LGPTYNKTFEEQKAELAKKALAMEEERQAKAIKDAGDAQRREEAEASIIPPRSLPSFLHPPSVSLFFLVLIILGPPGRSVQKVG
jgi:hypothetical protein